MAKKDFVDHHDHFRNSTPESEWKSCLEHAEKDRTGKQGIHLDQNVICDPQETTKQEHIRLLQPDVRPVLTVVRLTAHVSFIASDSLLNLAACSAISSFLKVIDLHGALHLCQCFCCLFSALMLPSSRILYTAGISFANSFLRSRMGRSSSWITLFKKFLNFYVSQSASHVMSL